MKSIKITESFTGYPGVWPNDVPPDAPARLFEKDAQIDDLPDDYADLLIKKGLATLAGGAKAARPAAPAATITNPEPTA